YDGAAVGPLGAVVHSTGLLGGAMVLGRGRRADATVMQVRLVDAEPARAAAAGPLALHAGGNASAPMLPLFDALAAGAARASLDAGAGRSVEITLDEHQPV